MVFIKSWDYAIAPDSLEVGQVHSNPVGYERKVEALAIIGGALHVRFRVTKGSATSRYKEGSVHVVEAWSFCAWTTRT